MDSTCKYMDCKRGINNRKVRRSLYMKEISIQKNFWLLLFYLWVIPLRLRHMKFGWVKKAGLVETRPGYVFITWENCIPKFIKLFKSIGDQHGEAWIFLPGSTEITIEIKSIAEWILNTNNIININYFSGVFYLNKTQAYYQLQKNHSSWMNFCFLSMNLFYLDIIMVHWV